MSNIRFENVEKSYSKTKKVIEDLNLEIQDGTFTVLVGPSGCGKTTLLRMIAGLEEISAGNLYIGSREVSKVDPGDREIAMVFQNYALYPHMSVRKNIEFGLKNAGIPKDDIKRRVQEVVKVVGLENYIDSKPSSLSGGQRQRVALARAISKQPKVFLMDEPLSNLDAKLRNAMRSELIQLHRKLNSTFVYVTHDQIEAMTMGDNIVVMKDGQVMQQGKPQEIFQNPINTFVATFIGDPGMNIINIQNYYVGFRPKKVLFQQDDQFKGFKTNGKIKTREILGDDTLYSCETIYGSICVKSNEEREYGDSLPLYVKYEDLYFFNQNGDRIYDMQDLQLII